MSWTNQMKQFTVFAIIIPLTYSWFLGILPSANISDGGYIQNVQFIILVNPTQIKAFWIDAHRDWCAWRWFLWGAKRKKGTKINLATIHTWEYIKLGGFLWKYLKNNARSCGTTQQIHLRSWKNFHCAIMFLRKTHTHTLHRKLPKK